MSYYQGDFYRGDYYRGDPGFFSFLGGLAKSAVGMIPGVGGLASTVLGKVTQKALPGAMAGGGRMTAITTGIGKMIAKHPVISGAAAAGMIGGASRITKRAGKMHILGGPVKKHRRMNVTNPRALRRAIRRTHGFARLAMRTIHIVHPKKRGRFGGFKKRRRRAV